MPEVGTKRSNYEYEGDGTEKKSRQEEGYKIRLLVLGRYAGPLIGKGGENLKRLREAYDVKITGLSSRANERVVQIDGPRSECLGVVKELLPLCPEARYNSWSSKATFEINMLANADAVGIIIGKGGSKLREIAEQTDTKLKVFPECLPNSNERVIALGGETEEIIIKGIETISGILDTAPKRSSTVYFHPDNADGQELGELQGKGNSGITNINGSPQGLPGNINLEVLENTNISLLLVKQRSFKEENGFDPSIDFGSIETVTTITLTNEICGAIIGKGGQNIRYIKQVSGAQIDMNKSDGDQERKITLTGSQDQIQIAEQLMAQCVRSSKLGGQQQSKPQQQQQQQQQQQYQRPINAAIQHMKQEMQNQPSTQQQYPNFDPYMNMAPQPWD